MYQGQAEIGGEKIALSALWEKKRQPVPSTSGRVCIRHAAWTSARLSALLGPIRHQQGGIGHSEQGAVVGTVILSSKRGLIFVVSEVTLCL